MRLPRRALPAVVTLVVAVLVTALAAARADAQACAGLPSFREGPFRLTAAGTFPERATTWAATVGAGKHESTWGAVGLRRTTFDASEEKETSGTIEVGYQLPVAHGRAQLCPIVSGGYGTNSSDGSELELRVLSASAGLALGIPVRVASAVELVPNAAVAWTYRRVSFEDDADDAATEDRAGVLRLGLGLVAGGRLSVQPTYEIPFGTMVDEKSAIGVVVGLTFGSRR